MGRKKKMQLDLTVLRKGRTVKKLTAEVDPNDADELRELLVGVINRNGGHKSHIADYEMQIRHPGHKDLLTTFASKR